jgi:hypothetical protein
MSKDGLCYHRFDFHSFIITALINLTLLVVKVGEILKG